jgi:NADH-quinone oxidoreductase subunit L
LIGFWYEKGWPAEAGQKAFVMNRVGDACFLLGSFILARSFASLDLTYIGAALPGAARGSSDLAVAGLLLFAGACGKSAQIPLFTWLPDAMAGPTPVSALIHAATMVTAGIYLVVRLNPLFAASPELCFLIGTVGALTALVAGSSALVQRDIKKVLAYSTVSQLGFMFLALSAGAFASAIFHLVTHAFFKALLFLGAGSVIHGLHDEQDMHAMGGLRRHMPVTFVTFACGAAALAGLPLSSGFFSKDEILARTFGQGGPYLVLWVVGMVVAAMTAFYTARMVALTFYGRERFDRHHLHPHESPRVMTFPLIVLAALSLAGGLLGLPEVLGVGHAIHGWLAPVIEPGEALLALHASAAPVRHSTEWVLLGASALIAVWFSWNGWRAYRDGPRTDVEFAERQPGLWAFLAEAWRFDRLYDRWIVQPVKLAGFVIAVVVDQFAIDGLVNGAAALAQGAGRRLRAMADGRVASYGLWMGAVSVLMLLFFLLRAR